MPRDHGRRLAELLDADLVELPDAYVLVSEDQPQALVRELLAFLPTAGAPR
jgi:pimeloyl-ACP methyl ester carboxylesterase